MKSPVLNFLLGVISAISLVFALSYYLNLGVLESSITVDVIKKITSPDNNFMATTTRASNQNGWCEERTNIHKKDEDFDWETEYIFNIDCGSAVELKWIDSENLAIIYSYNKDGLAKTSQTFTSENKDVNVSYILKQ